jgi:hypothetical protein
LCINKAGTHIVTLPLVSKKGIHVLPEMREYYIYINGGQEGPFLLNELKTKGLGPDTPVWYAGAGKWLPAAEVDELREDFLTLSRETPAVAVASKSYTNSDGDLPAHKKRNRNKGMLIGCVLLLAIIVGAFLYSRYHAGEELARKERIRQIREAEVQKALLERRNARWNEQETKKKLEARKALLTQRQNELVSLRKQYLSVKARYDEALLQLDDIRRPRLFRSGARREAEIEEQMQVIHSLENKARTLDGRINKCRQDIDQLSRK